MTKFIKTDPKRASFLKSAEELVEARPDPAPVTAMDQELERMDAEQADMRRRMEGEHRARTRARTLLSMEVTRSASPSERIRIKTPEGFPIGLRWCDDEYRDKMGMDIWTAVTPEEYEDLKPFVNSDQVSVKDGRVVTGGLFLAKAPRVKLEQRNGLHYQRSQRALRQAAAGRSSLMRRTGSGEKQMPVSAGASMGDLEAQANAGGGDPQIQYTGELRDDSLAGYTP